MTDRDSERYYQDFSLQVGAQDWRRPNGRHERLRLLVDDLVGGTREPMRILDLGCGAGVMTSFLCRYGEVTGSDFSRPAIELASLIEPRATFMAGPLEELETADRFDLITMFDVVEHIPPAERPAAFAQLGRLLSPRGWVVFSTPHASFTSWLHEHRPDLLQVIDEPVPLDEVIALARSIEREVVVMRTYDVDDFRPRQYQLIALAPHPDAAEWLRPAPAARRVRSRLAAALVARWGTPRALTQAAVLLRAGRLRAAAWVLRGDAQRPPVSRGGA